MIERILYQEVSGNLHGSTSFDIINATYQEIRISVFTPSDLSDLLAVLVKEMKIEFKGK